MPNKPIIYPLELLILQVNSFCNLNCNYCYLSETTRSNHNIMGEDIIDRAIYEAAAYPEHANKFSILLHAGEPLSAPESLYEFIAETIIKHFGNKQPPPILVQTNATLISQKWCDLFKKLDVRIGVSIDGPEYIHNIKRVKRNGSGTFRDVMNGINLLKKNDIDFNAICVISDANIDFANELYNFFKNLGCRTVGFSPEEQDGSNLLSSLDSLNEQSVFLFFKTIFEMWKKDDAPLDIREVRHIFNFLDVENIGGRFLLDNQMNRPGKIITVANNGAVSTYSPELISISDKFHYGNILHHNFQEILSADNLIIHDIEIRKGIQRCKRDCDVFEFCGGGTPSSKYSEHNTFDSSFTQWCRRSRLSLVEAAIAGLNDENI